MVGVVDADDVRRIALSLPHTVEIDSDGFDFRVGNRGFVWSYPEYVPGERRVVRTDIAVLYVGDEAEKQALLLSEPEVFFTTSTYDWSPLVMVRLERIDMTRLALTAFEGEVSRVWLHTTTSITPALCPTT